MPSDLTDAVTLAIGPEGGWTDYEVEMLRDEVYLSFGQRILR